MGCNYYLKGNWIVPKTNASIPYIKGCIKAYEEYGDININELESPVPLKLSTFFEKTDKLHLGKSSYGWRFNLCVYPLLGIYKLEDYFELFKSCEIVDEYDKVISTEQFLEIINSHKDGEKHESSITPTFDGFLPVECWFVSFENYDATNHWDFS